MTEAYAQACIVRTLVNSLLRAGCAIDVNSRESTELGSSTDRKAILAAIFDPAIDEDTYTLDVIIDGEHAGYVLLVDGNGTSVISDYTTNLEPFLVEANALANRIDDAPDAWLRAELESRDAMADMLGTVLQRFDLEPKESVFPCSALRDDIRTVLAQVNARPNSHSGAVA